MSRYQDPHNPTPYQAADQDEREQMQRDIKELARQINDLKVQLHDIRGTVPGDLQIGQQSPGMGMDPDGPCGRGGVSRSN